MYERKLHFIPSILFGSALSLALQVTSLQSNEYWGLSPWVKHLGPEDDHSPKCSVKVKNMWSHTSTPSDIFMVLFFIKNFKK